MTTPSSQIQSQLVTVARLESVTAFIPELSTFKGDFTAEQGSDLGMKIDGKLEGSIVIPTGGVIHIGPKANVKGSIIEADFVFVEGSVESKIVCRKGVELSSTSVVKGQIEYHGALNMHSQAKVRASIQYMGAEEE